MAALTSDQFSEFFSDGKADRFVVFSVKGVNTNDTVDLSAWFKDVKLAIILWTTTAKSDKLTGIASNVVTLATTGLAKDGGWLSVWGTSI